jgi:hypothetical protein
MKLFHTRTFVLGFIILSLAACGGSGSSQTKGADQESNQENTNTETPNLPEDIDQPDTSQATNLITTYELLTFNTEVGLLEDDEDLIDSDMASRGLYNSGSRLGAYQVNFNLHVGVFVENTEDYIKTVAGIHATSSSDILAVINQYNANWLEVMTNTLDTHFTGFPSNATNTIKTELTTSINTDFELLKLALIAVAII